MYPALAHRGWLRHVAALAQHRFSTATLAAIAFADSSFLPIPPDLLLVPMTLMRPERLRFLLVICTVFSSLGAVLGYVIGYALWTTVGMPLVAGYGYTAQFTAFQDVIQQWGWMIIIAKAFTPIPFKIAAIGAGVAEMNLVTFMIATIVGRALHFLIVGAMLVFFGTRCMALIARYERPLGVISVLVLLGVGIVCWLK